MSLKNIPLPAIVLANLYKHSIVDSLKSEKASPLLKNDPAFAQRDNKRILLLVNNAEADLLPAEEMRFLSGILTACKLSMEDIAIVNLYKSDLSDKDSPAFLSSEIIILFGIDLTSLDLPFKIPAFQVQLHKNKKYVHFPSLPAIEIDPVLKKKLWNVLRPLFLA